MFCLKIWASLVTFRTAINMNEWKRPSVDAPPAPASNSNHARQICLCNLDLVTLTLWPWHLTSFSDARIKIRRLTLTSWPLTLNPWPWPLTSFSDTRLKIRILHFWPLWPWPMTLTFELIRAPLKIYLPTRFQVHRSNGLAARVETDRQTHTHTHRDWTENITSSANSPGIIVLDLEIIVRVSIFSQCISLRPPK